MDRVWFHNLSSINKHRHDMPRLTKSKCGGWRGDSRGWYACIDCGLIVGCSYMTIELAVFNYVYEAILPSLRRHMHKLDLSWIAPHYITPKYTVNSSYNNKFKDKIITNAHDLENDNVMYVDVNSQHLVCKKNASNPNKLKWFEQLRELRRVCLHDNEDIEEYVSIKCLVFQILFKNNSKQFIEETRDIMSYRLWSDSSLSDHKAYLTDQEKQWFDKVKKEDVENLVKVFTPPGFKPLKNFFASYKFVLTSPERSKPIKMTIDLQDNTIYRSAPIICKAWSKFISFHDVLMNVSGKAKDIEAFHDQVNGEETKLRTKNKMKVVDLKERPSYHRYHNVEVPGKVVVEQWPEFIKVATKCNVDVDSLVFRFLDSGYFDNIKVKQFQDIVNETTQNVKKEQPNGKVLNPITGRFIDAKRTLAKKLASPR